MDLAQDTSDSTSLSAYDNSSKAMVFKNHEPVRLMGEAHDNRRAGSVQKAKISHTSTHIALEAVSLISAMLGVRLLIHLYLIAVLKCDSFDGRVRGINHWNELPMDVVASPYLDVFRSRLGAFLES
ncbi:unnamed protein product [Caretta caretta]